MAISKDRPFKNWIIDHFTISSPDRKYCLWIGNGYTCFEDYNRFYTEEPFLALMNFWQKWKIWRAIKREKYLRSKDILTSYAS